jgi:hypothetical protein
VRKSALLLLATLLTCPFLRANIAYSDFSGGTYNTSVSIITNDTVAQLFTATSSGSLFSLTFALGTSQIATTPNIADIFLYADNAGQPGAVLESLSFDVGSFHNPASDPAPLIVTVNSVTNPLIFSGQNYWVGVLSDDFANHPIIWYWGFGSDPGVDIFFNGAWVPESPTPTSPFSLEVAVTPAPEPATWSFALAGLAAVCWRIRKLKITLK